MDTTEIDFCTQLESSHLDLSAMLSSLSKGMLMLQFAKPLQLETSHLDLSVMLSLVSKFTPMLQFAHLSRWIWNLVE
jgi:hypothetical protein